MISRRKVTLYTFFDRFHHWCNDEGVLLDYSGGLRHDIIAEYDRHSPRNVYIQETWDKDVCDHKEQRVIRESVW